MSWCKLVLCLFVGMLVAATGNTMAQESTNDTIRLGAITEHGKVYPMAFLPEYFKTGLYINGEDRIRRDRLRRDIYVVYPYAITAAAIMKDVNATLDTLERRKERRRYLKSVDRQLDASFKEPLKNLTIDQGHVLIKLINRQTGKNCYSIIRELKGGFSAVLWQSVGVMFNNNLRRDYDPEDKDKEMETMVQILEASANYRYQLYMQQEMMKKVPKPVARKGG
ncbi:MAG: DUF4294 domain-containing protein [Taibaiella sp.]|nr:DUF4294 domain-containing protein [Taibaiella sp.]